MTKKLGIVVFDGVELLDFAGPYETFAVAASQVSEVDLEVCCVGPQSELNTEHGPSILADHTFSEEIRFDWLLVPGGEGARTVMRDPESMNWLIRHGESAELLMSVCTGAVVLGACGFLQGIPATTHHQYLERLKTVAPACEVVSGKRVVDSGRIVTAGGVTSGIDLGLHIINREFGEHARQQVVDYLQYQDA